MTDPTSLAADAIHHLDRLGAAILDDVGDGPTPTDFSARAADAHSAVVRIGVGALSELTGLIVGVGNSLLAGATEWNTSLGGTLISAVDDLRALIPRAAGFSAEDSEHLHQRAVDLSGYVRVSPESPQAMPTPPAPAAAPPVSTPAPMAAHNPDPKPAPTSNPPAPPPAPRASISDFFYADGPQVISGGVPKAAASASEMLGAGIDALDDLNVETLAAPLESATTVIPVGDLVYRGRAALERAAVLRDTIKTSGTPASPQTLDEMYDLIDLALKD